MLEIHNLTVSYGSKNIISELNLELKRGTLNALIGPNGSGKSTLLRTLAGIKKPASGTIILNGQRIGSMTLRERARHIAFVFASGLSRVEGMTVREMVSNGRTPYSGWLGQLDESDDRVIERTLNMMNLSDMKERTVDTLSDGEFQRTLIAAALAQDSEMILLDEPTSFLDLPTRHSLAVLLKKIAQELDKIIIMSTHELDVALRICDTSTLIDPMTQSAHYFKSDDEALRVAIKHIFDPRGEMATGVWERL